MPTTSEIQPILDALDFVKFTDRAVGNGFKEALRVLSTDLTELEYEPSTDMQDVLQKLADEIQDANEKLADEEEEKQDALDAKEAEIKRLRAALEDDALAEAEDKDADVDEVEDDLDLEE